MFSAAPSKSTIVADVTLSVWAQRCAIWSAVELSDRFTSSGRRDAREPRACNFHDQNAAVGKGDGAFGEGKSRRNFTADELHAPPAGRTSFEKGLLRQTAEVASRV